MSTWYEVTVTASKTIVVEIDDSSLDPEDEADEIAKDEAFSFCENVESEVVSLSNTKDIKIAKRHADQVICLAPKQPINI